MAEHNAWVLRRTWPASISGLLSPPKFLCALGLGLGRLIDRPVDGMPYLDFLAPGLLAAAAMQEGVAEAAWPVIARINWTTYAGMLTAPLDAADIALGELTWIALRLLVKSAAFVVVMVALGAIHSPWALLAAPAGVLTGLAFAAPTAALSALRPRARDVQVIVRIVVLPMFLLAGTFLPIGRLPGPAQAVAWATPLSHGVALTRSLTSGNVDPGGTAVHLAALAAWLVAGLAAALPALRSRLNR